MTLVPRPRDKNLAGSIRLELAVLLAILFVALNMLDAELTSLALSLGSSEMNRLAESFGFDLVLKTLISSAFVLPLLAIRWWRVLVPLCAGMFCVVIWNTVAVWTWL